MLFRSNLDAGQEATVRTGHGTTDWFQIGKGVRQGCILSFTYFSLFSPLLHTFCSVLYDKPRISCLYWLGFLDFTSPVKQVPIQNPKIVCSIFSFDNFLPTLNSHVYSILYFNIFISESSEVV